MHNDSISKLLSLKNLTLSKLFVATTFIVTFVIGAVFIVLINSSGKSILANGEKRRETEAMRIEERVAQELSKASNVLLNLERSMLAGAIALDDIAAPEAALYVELLNNPTISDITFTHARSLGFASTGEMEVATEGRWQISVFRIGSAAIPRIVSQLVLQKEGQFESYIRDRPIGGSFSAPEFKKEAIVTDPTLETTFEVVSAKQHYNRAIWSDLHWSELDLKLPTYRRRVVVTVQKAIQDSTGNFIGVLRVGLNTRTIDEIPQQAEQHLEQMEGGKGLYRVFLSDTEGRLLARPNPQGKLDLSGDDLRVTPINLDPVIAAALSSPYLPKVDVDYPGSDTLDVDNRQWLVSFRMLKNTQDWVIGIAVPKDFYTRDLRSLRDNFLLIFALTTLFVFSVGSLVLRQLKRGLGSIASATARMHALDFTPTQLTESFHDITEVQIEIERAKTSLRALSKYVPLDLVRNLYHANREPALGGELVELSIMFSDIEGFTTFAEKLAPQVLADALGLYLNAVAQGVQSTGGTVDKFIGDSVMAFWNAPNRIQNHPSRACHSVLACMHNLEDLYKSIAWQPQPPLATRYGLHVATVVVGHFGAPDRFNYTALGDGVNLASRLEGLCKLYGVSVLASEAFVTRAGDDFAFRLLDKVAVRGKTEGVYVYEFLGTTDDASTAGEERKASIAAYDIALQAYFNRQFKLALEILSPYSGLKPSAILAERCRHLLIAPPPMDWNGIFIAK